MPFIKITVTVPKEIVNTERVRQAIISAQNSKTKPKLLRLFGRTVQGWDHPPTFLNRRVDTSSQLGIRVEASGPNADKYSLVSRGAKAHFIRPRRARMLRFQPGYTAGTHPRSLSSRHYQRSGGFVTSMQVRHPGFDAREFDQTIADEHRAEFEQDMRDAIRDGTKK